MQRQAELAASAGGQARSMAQPAFVAPKSLKPINSGNIDIVRVGRRIKLELPAEPKEVPNWFLDIVAKNGSDALAYLMTGWLSEGSVSGKAYNMIAELVKYYWENKEAFKEDAEAAWNSDSLHVSTATVASTIKEWTSGMTIDGGYINYAAEGVENLLAKKEAYQVAQAYQKGDYGKMVSKYVLGTAAFGLAGASFLLPSAGAAVTGVAAAALPSLATYFGKAATAYLFSKPEPEK